MNIKIKLLIILLGSLFFLGCEKTKEFNIAVNEWIGYAPIFYANENGCLKKNNFKLITTVSLNESVELFKDKLVDVFAATQYEYKILNNKNIIPIALFDRSYGGDMAFSNYSLDELQKVKQIDVYLEINSVNSIILEYLKKHYLKYNKLIIHNMDQLQIKKIKLPKTPFIVITYSPYDNYYLKKGYKKIICSKKKDLFIIDALFTDKKLYLNYKEKFDQLKVCIKNSINDLKKDPKHFYKKIRNYFNEEYTYQDFLNNLKLIKWIDRKDIEKFNYH